MTQFCNKNKQQSDKQSSAITTTKGSRQQWQQYNNNYNTLDLDSPIFVPILLTRKNSPPQNNNTVFLIPNKWTS